MKSISTRDVDGAAQVGHKDIRAAENADQQELVLAGVVLGDLCAQFFHTGLQLFFGVQDFLDAVRHIHGSFSSLSHEWNLRQEPQ